jgi:predicted nucleotidyltransferase component of viral defense system
VQSRNLLDIDHVEFVLEGVKLSFYSSPKYSPVKKTIPLLHNLRLADIKSIGAMKMEVMMRRSNFRDYYDVYSILKEGVPIKEMIALALDYSGHRMKTKNLLAMLTKGARFMRDAHFEQLSPIYQVTTSDIENYIKDCLSNI